MARFKIAHMYPDLMNLYGDRGNLICLQQRFAWYGCESEIVRVTLNELNDFESFDMLFMGGGSDREQGLVYNDLLQQSEQLMRVIENEMPVLCICGAYQLLGQYYKALDGQTLQGLGFFDFYTESKSGRLIGNILIEAELNNQIHSVVGFENHGGRTYFADNRLKPLGKVIKGFGNNGEDRYEGLHYKNLIGTYLHGPLLPKNPALADYFIKVMAQRRGIGIMREIDDTIENLAHQQVKNKILAGK